MEVREPHQRSRTRVTTAVLGPGAVGGALGVRMARAGERVVFVARAAAAAAIAENGLTLATDAGEHTLRAVAREQLEEPVDLLLVTVKATGLDDAISRIQAEPGLVLPLLNGLEHMGVLAPGSATSSRPTVGNFEGSQGIGYACRPATPGARRAWPRVRPRTSSSEAASTRVGGSEEDVLWEKLARQGPIAAAHLCDRADDRRAALRSPTAPGRRGGVRSRCGGRGRDDGRRPVGDHRGLARLGNVVDGARRRRGRPSELDAIGGAISARANASAFRRRS